MPLRGEVVAIGNELLSGRTLNSNATWISGQLRDLGVEVQHHQVVPDAAEEICSGLDLALSRSDVVVATGGLGPTCDDLTRSVIADYFGTELTLNDEVLSDLKKRYGNRKISLEDQATIPKSAHYFLNQVGTAPGLCFEKEGKWVFFIQGVPLEMESTFRTGVAPFLEERLPKPQRMKQKKIHLIQVSESEIDPLLRLLSEEHCNVEIGCYPAQGTLTVTFSSLKGEDELEECADVLRQTYAKQHFESVSGTIEEALHHHLCENGLTLGIAESCTGGAIITRMSARSGASAFLQGGVISYANEVKENLLGVRSESLKAYGAVSEEVAREMAEGICKATGATCGISTTGVAGPTGGSEEKPVGLVWVAIAHRGKETITRKLQLKGNRESIIRRCSTILLSDLWKVLSHG